MHAVEAAIFNRLEELAQTSERTDHKAEEQAIAEALDLYAF
jgi:predicted transcriptional regulator